MGDNAANLEGRIKRLENMLKDETGAGTGTSGTSGTIRYPVRQLTLREEVSHDDAGVPVSTVLITWKSPAGSTIPDKIKLTIGAESVELGGQETSYRKGGYAAGDTVKVIAVAVYSYGNSSAVVAQLLLDGQGEAPGTPLNFKVVGGFQTFTLSWDIPDDPNHSHMEVWESVIYDNLESAERIAQAYGSEFVRSNVGVLETRWYWIRAVDTGGNKGEFVGPVHATTTAIQASDIPDGTIEESKLVGTLSQKINDSNAAIEVIEQTRTGEVEVYQQATAPTEGMQTGDLWIDDDEAVWRYIGGEWVKQENTTMYDLLKAAISQYTVKTQTMADGKLKVAGFGIFNDSSTGSEFAILADRFYIYGQSQDGTYTNIKVFSVDTTQSPPVVGINGSLIVDGTVNGSKIFAGSTIQLGTVVDGVLTSGQLIIGAGGKIQIGDNIIIDGGNGTFFLRASDNENNNVYIGGGIVRIMRNFGDVQPYCYLLSRLGTASGLTNNVVKALSGVWSEPPVVATGLTDMRTYDPAYEASQEIETDVTGLTYQTGGVYNVAAYARLVTSGGQYTWVADEILEPTEYWTDSLGHKRTGWHYSVEPPTKTYTFSWYGTVQDVQYVTARLYLSSVRNNPYAARYWYTAVFQIYFDYINQSTGATVSQLVATYSIQAPTCGSSAAEYLYLSRVQLGALASNVRVRVVVSNGSSFLLYPDSPSITHSDSSDWLRFAGGALFKSDSTEHATIYNGTIDALAVGR